MTEKKNNTQQQPAAEQPQRDASLEHPHVYAPSGFLEKLTGRRTGGAGKAAPPDKAARDEKGAAPGKTGQEAKQPSVQQKKARSQSAQKGTGSARNTRHPDAKARGTQASSKAAPKEKDAAEKKPTAGRTKSSGSRQKKAGQAAAPAPAAAVPATKAQEKKKTGRAGSRSRKKGGPTLKIIPLGGLGEIGKNFTVYEYDDDIIIVDCGLAFPDDDLLGVDLVIPDFTYVERNRDKIRGVFLTHGHEDHIGGLPYLMDVIKAPVYGGALTLGLLGGKLKEHGNASRVKLKAVKAGDVVKAGVFSVEFIHVNHSIPDSCALAIETPVGMIVQTGDFKIDYTPIQGGVIDLVRFGELGSKGVLALLCDSTNAERPGRTPSESTVGENLDKLFTEARERRIIVATFASNIHRIQQIVDSAEKCGRKVAVFGRSMLNAVAVATELGYLTSAPGTIIDVDQMHNYTDGQIVLICTGSQGEPMSALTRMSTGDHRKVHIGSNDRVIISANPIPGNEKLVDRVVNELMKLGADVIYERMYGTHVSGHACQDEIRTIISLTRPKFFMPVHGEYKHLIKNAGTARSMGMDPKNIIISDIGKVVEVNGSDMRITGMVPSGRIMVDGSGVGDVGSIVLRDRKKLSEDGLIIAVLTIDSASEEILAGPDLVSRGFVYVRESEEMMEDAKAVVIRTLERCRKTGLNDWASIKGSIRDELSDFIFNRTKRKPMILPIIQET